jgi:hypothetical protein
MYENFPFYEEQKEILICNQFERKSSYRWEFFKFKPLKCVLQGIEKKSKLGVIKWQEELEYSFRTR